MKKNGGFKIALGEWGPYVKPEKMSSYILAGKAKCPNSFDDDCRPRVSTIIFVHFNHFFHTCFIPNLFLFVYSFRLFVNFVMFCFCNIIMINRYQALRKNMTIF